MSPEMNRLAPADAAQHERARMLAAEAVDGQLAPADAEWLTAHFETCADCAAVAGEYDAIHTELRSLATPQPPRDLWARTAAALDAVDAKAAGRSRGLGRGRTGDRPLVMTAVAVGCVVVVAAASLLAQSPVVAPAPAATRSDVIALATPSAVRSFGSPEAPLAVVNGTSYWIAADAGVYQIKGGTAECAASDGSCTVASSGVKTLGSIASDQSVSAAIAPDASRAAVWTPDKVVILPLANKPATVSIDLLTPQPTLIPTPTPTPITPAATASPVPSPSASAASPAAASASPTPSASTGPNQTPTPAPTATAAPPTSTPTPRTSTTAPQTPAPSAAAATGPIAILSGYEVVGRDPEFSPDGSLVAFAARPVDHSTGPDVFVWRSGQSQATPITFRHSGLFAGWFGGRILISEVSVPGAASGAARSTSYVFDPSTGSALQIGRPMLLPAVDPTGKYLVYWAGTVALDPATGLWGPAGGDLYFETWSDLTLTPVSLGPVVNPSPSPSLSPSPTPSAAASLAASPAPTADASPAGSAGATQTPAASPRPSAPAPTETPVQPAPPQILPVAVAPGMVRGWIVAWDARGGHVAVWIADPGSTRVGRLSLLSVDRAGGHIVTNEPLLAADKVSSNIALDDDHLVYTSAIDGKTYMQAIPAVPPSTVATPAATTPAPQPSGAAVSAQPSAEPTDRPGN